MDQPVVIGIGGFTSNVGKTTLMCELLRAFPGWEAIKTTRGHYRSCGKDPHACCVSHLLSDEPLVRSGREETYEAVKDTGRYLGRWSSERSLVDRNGRANRKGNSRCSRASEITGRVC